MKRIAHSISKVVLVLALFTLIAHAFEDGVLLLENGGISTTHNKDELTESGDRTLISKMIERGKILMKSLPRTGIQLAGSVRNFIPTPETIFNVGKNALIGLPQELIAYAINSVCKIKMIDLLIAFSIIILLGTNFH